MASESKSRPFDTVLSGTSWNSIGGEQFRAAEVGQAKYLDGHVGNRNIVNPLLIRTLQRTVPVMNGVLTYAPTGQVLRKIEHCPIGNWYDTLRDPAIDIPSINHATLIEYAWEILAKTNPSRPHVSVPTFVAEMRDIPSLVRGYGRGVIKDLANANLSFRWGFAPLISDIKKLFEFTRAVEKRFRELKNLRDGKTKRTKCHLDTGEVALARQRVFAESSFASIYAYRQFVSSYNVWGTCEWKLAPGSNLPSFDDGSLRKLAERQIAGLTSHGALETTWELLPWSWLIDWFSNVGDIISATNNTTNLTWGRIAVMRKSTCRTHFDFDPVGSSTWVTLDGWYECWYERKERWPAYPAIPFPLPTIPTLDAGKWSILLSLAALRR